MGSVIVFAMTGLCFLEDAMDGSEIYGKISPAKLFFTIAVPGAVSMIASSLWGVFDGVFVGHLLGDDAFAALNFAFPFVLLCFCLADLVGVGSAVHISVLLGRKDNAGANNYFSCACLMIIAVSALMGAILFFLAPHLMYWLGARGTLAQMGAVYLKVYALTAPLTSMIFAVDNFLRICGKIKTSMSLNILMSILILALEYFMLGILKMGIEGSALAVSLGMFLCTLIALYPFFRGQLTLRFVKPKPTFRMIRQIAACGSPNFLSSIASRLTSIIMNVVLLRLGGAIAVSIYGVLLYVGDTLMQFLYGTCDGMQPAIGYNWGAGKIARVRRLMLCTTVAGAVISLSGTFLMLRCPEILVSLFVRQEETELIAMAVQAMGIYSLTYLTRWFGFVVQSFLVALEKPLPATILSVSYALILPIGLLPLLWKLKLTGIWLNAPISALCVSIMALYFHIHLHKKELHT